MQLLFIFAQTNTLTMASYWTEELKTTAIKLILDGIVEGRSVRSILNPATRDKLVYPSYVEFLEWVEESESLAKQYARAMEWRAEGLLEDTIDIADDASRDTTELDGETRTNVEHIQRTKLRVEARQFALRKMAPKKYGERLDVTSDGEKLPSMPTVVVSSESEKQAIESFLSKE